MISTGLKKIDNFLSGGIPDGVIVDIFGENGTGKTQLLLQLLINSIKNGGKVLFLDTTGGFRPERILEIQKKSNTNFNLLDNIIVSRVTNSSEQINSIKNFDGNTFSLIVIDNITDLFSYEYKKNQLIFKKNSLFMKYMHELSSYALAHKIPIVITNMIRNLNEQEVENMATAIDLFTHIKIHLFKNSSNYRGEIYSPFNKEIFSYTITSSGLCDDDF